VRAKAKELGLSTADQTRQPRHLFVGKSRYQDFLLHELGEQPYGLIVDQDGKTIGEHDGAIFYTIGQRHGLNVGGGLPYYVSRKTWRRNTVYVTTKSRR